MCPKNPPCRGSLLAQSPRPLRRLPPPAHPPIPSRPPPPPAFHLPPSALRLDTTPCGPITSLTVSSMLHVVVERLTRPQLVVVFHGAGYSQPSENPRGPPTRFAPDRVRLALPLGCHWLCQCPIGRHCWLVQQYCHCGRSPDRATPLDRRCPCPPRPACVPALPPPSARRLHLPPGPCHSTTPGPARATGGSAAAAWPAGAR
jgi:hypothetical protein